MLLLEGLVKRFGDVTALDGCGFSVRRGEMVGFLGPNGAGKTTAMRSIFGLVEPDAGNVEWDDAPIDAAVRIRFGYMPEERGLYPRMGVFEQLVHFGRLHGMTPSEAARASRYWLERFDLADRSTSRVLDLSHGNQQRVQLIVALLHEPELLVLDEPFSGLDPLALQAMAGVLAERANAGAAVLFSSHQLDVVEDLCRDVVIIDKGRPVLSGVVEELRAASPLRYLDVVVRDGPIGWWDRVPGTKVLEQSGNRVRFAVDGAELEELAAAVANVGKAALFSLTPPDLSEVFREAVEG